MIWFGIPSLRDLEMNAQASNQATLSWKGFGILQVQLIDWKWEEKTERNERNALESGWETLKDWTRGNPIDESFQIFKKTVEKLRKKSFKL